MEPINPLGGMRVQPSGSAPLPAAGPAVSQGTQVFHGRAVGWVLNSDQAREDWARGDWARGASDLGQRLDLMDAFARRLGEGSDPGAIAGPPLGLRQCRALPAPPDDLGALLRALAQAPGSVSP